MTEVSFMLKASGGEVMRNFVVLLSLAFACGPASMSLANSASPIQRPVSKELLRATKTLSGQPLRLANDQSEIVASATDFPPNGRTPVHMHPWSRFVYVERGPLWVTNFDEHETDEFQTGQVFAEAIGEWHQGHAGPSGARLIVFDLVPHGTLNVVAR
jgi:quercetin dioxygenase-like cupin family protein